MADADFHPLVVKNEVVGIFKVSPYKKPISWLNFIFNHFRKEQKILSRKNRLLEH